MQYINLNKIIELEKNIIDLLLISIDDQINIVDDKEGIKISGKILVSGKVKTIEGEEEISDDISLDLFLINEEIVERNSLNVSVNDFNYEIKDGNLLLNVTLKIEGLKEINTTFLTQEDNGFFQEEVEETEQLIQEEIEDDQNKKDICIEVDIDINDRKKEAEKIEEYENIKEDNLVEETQILDQIKSLKPEKKSLLKSIFASRKISEEVSWKLHCVKNGDSYENIASKYGVDLKKLISLNNNEKLEEGKLIFLPLN